MARLPPPISDYVGDTKSALDQSLRVLQVTLKKEFGVEGLAGLRVSEPISS